MVILVDSPHMLMSVDLLHIYEEAGPNIILRTILTAALLAARNHEMSSFWFFSFHRVLDGDLIVPPDPFFLLN